MLEILLCLLYLLSLKEWKTSPTTDVLSREAGAEASVAGKIKKKKKNDFLKQTGKALGKQEEMEN